MRISSERVPFLVKSSTKNEAGSSVGKEEVTGIIIVDHGSRKPEANDMLIEVFSILFPLYSFTSMSQLKLLYCMLV